ncbi:alkaline phosphatase family protein [Candidatus Pacearchaeota archaeon]|nr:alkaline phosphatase family protein [Candidatus Pacearchaeota archaeon]
MGKIFVLGIDGAFPEYIFGEWLDDLPNIKKMVKEGSYAKLNSTIPPLSVTAWSSIYTGKSPADTGIFEYIYRKNNSYDDIHVVTSKNLKEKSIWEIASEHGKKSIVCYLNLTWPIKPFNGWMVSDSIFGSEKDKDSCVYPHELKKELENFLGEIPPLDIASFRDFTKEEIVEEVYKLTEKHINLMKYMLKNKTWDLFFGVIGMSDRMNHTFWKYMDKKHRKYDPNSKFKNTLMDFYKFLDIKIGEFIDLLDENVKIIVLSDHGITRMHNRINLTDWLIKNKYMVLKESVKEKCKFNPKMVDWEKTRVFAIGAYEGQIFINLENREPKGIVKKEEYGKLIEELTIKLKKILGDDGKELNTKVFIKKINYDGKMIAEAPDMIIYFDSLEYGCNTSLIGNETLWSPSTAKGSDDATHSQQGIFIMKDNKIRNKNVGEVNVIDVAPTILNSLGLEIPNDLMGKVIE